mmetsp:Transcript_44769/g.104578  ORF Transcript_44769/g.104578 Transcript_44769/m.104578 type:complete len:417 (+) Transcript_44769:1093-2343(+)
MRGPSGMRTSTVVTSAPAAGSSGRAACASSRESLRCTARAASTASCSARAAASCSACFAAAADSTACLAILSSASRICCSKASCSSRRRCSSVLMTAGAKSTSSSVSITQTESAGCSSTTKSSSSRPPCVMTMESPLVSVVYTPLIARSSVAFGSSSIANSSESGCSLAKVPLGSSAASTSICVPSLAPRDRITHNGTTTPPSGAENSRTPTCLPVLTVPATERWNNIGCGMRRDGTRDMSSCSVDCGSITLSPSLRATTSIASAEMHCNVDLHMPENGRSATSGKSASPPAAPNGKKSGREPLWLLYMAATRVAAAGSSPRDIAIAAASIWSSISPSSSRYDERRATGLPSPVSMSPPSSSSSSSSSSSILMLRRARADARVAPPNAAAAGRERRARLLEPPLASPGAMVLRASS